MMGRPRKEGLDYFPHDTNALNDEKIQFLISSFGASGYALYFAILERVFRAENTKIDLQKKYVAETLCRSLSISCESLHEFLTVSIEIGALVMLEDGSITSNGAVKRANYINELREKERKRKFSGGKLTENQPENSRKTHRKRGESKRKVKENKNKENEKEKGLKECAREEKNGETSPQKVKTSLPDDFGISPNVRKWAFERGIEKLEAHLEYFINACASNGYHYKDWDAAFRKAILGDWAKISAGNGNKREEKYVGLSEKNYHDGLDGFDS